MDLDAAHPPSRTALLGLCLAAGLAGLSVSIVRPILVDVAQTYAISVALAGQLVTVAAVAGTVGCLVLSPLLDRIGRRAAMLTVLGTMALGAALCVLSRSFVALSASYAIVGACAYVLLALVIASASDVYQGRALGRALGWITAGNVGVAVVCLPVLSYLAERVGWYTVFAGHALLAIAAGVFVAWSLRRAPVPRRLAQGGYLTSFQRVLRNRKAVILLVAVGLFYASVYGYNTYLGPVASERLGSTTAQVGLLFTVRLLVAAVLGVLAGRFLDTSSWRLGAAAAVAAALAALANYVLAEGTGWFVGVALVQAALGSLMDMELNQLLLLAEPEQPGTITSLRSMMEGLGGMAGPAAGGMLVAFGGYSISGWLYAALGLGAAASVVVGARLAGRRC